MTITILTLIVLTIGNGYYLVKTHKRLSKIEIEWKNFNKPLNNTKLLKLSGFKKYSKKK